LTATLELATRLAREAGDAILAVRHSARESPSHKGDSSPVTAADLAADAVICAGLAADASADVVVTEESWGARPMPPSGHVWVIDPLDGTSDFVAGTADYVVQIALVIDGVPRVGVIMQPETGLVWRGVVDDRDGVSFAERIDSDGTVTRLSVKDAPLPQRPRVAVSVSHPSAVVSAITDAIGADVVGIGSVGLKIGAIIDGRVDAYVTDSRHIKVWDSAAPAAVITAAGGVISGLSGGAIDYRGALAHDDGVFARIPAASVLQGDIDDVVGSVGARVGADDKEH
jgi:3'(2'), 5'-bisphosphate nucleotidase